MIGLKDGRWAAVEVKLGEKEIEDAAVHLLEGVFVVQGNGNVPAVAAPRQM